MIAVGSVVTGAVPWLRHLIGVVEGHSTTLPTYLILVRDAESPLSYLLEETTVRVVGTFLFDDFYLTTDGELKRLPIKLPRGFPWQTTNT